MKEVTVYRRILVPVELSDKDLRAVEAARALARANDEGDTEVALLHVIETLDLPFEELEDFYSKLESRAVEVLSELSASLAPYVASVERRGFLPRPRLPRAGETIHGSQLLQVPGGKGANQAVAAARQGADVEFVGCVGELYGEELFGVLDDHGVGRADGGMRPRRPRRRGDPHRRSGVARPLGYSPCHAAIYR